MSDSKAEQLDPSVLGERVGDDTRAGDDYPADEPMAVDDPSIVADGVIARDDVATREARTTDDAAGTTPTASPTPASPGLIETGDDPDTVDAEPELLADAGERDAAPETAAMRIEDDPS